MNYADLKAYHREHREGWNPDVSLRVHRALSWLKKAEAERENDDLDGEFVFLWVSFNAAYANIHSATSRITERDIYGQFFERLVENDTENQLYHLVWSHYAGAIRSLINNKFVFQPFWNEVNQLEITGVWTEQFEAAKRRANIALAEQDTVTAMSIVMDRLYTLRNQVLHGGATYNSRLNRKQLKDGCQLLAAILPIVIQLMMLCGEQVWGSATYSPSDVDTYENA